MQEKKLHIQDYSDVINACRFCFMCRHVATTAGVTFREADTPRGIALMMDRVRMNPDRLTNKDYITSLYDSALSGASRKHCVSGYDEVGLILAARRDVVNAGLAPSEAVVLADSIRSGFKPELKGDTGDVLYLEITSYTDAQPEISAAFAKVMKKEGTAYRTLRVNDTGKTPAVLGFVSYAEDMAALLRDTMLKSGCKTVVTSCPAAYDALHNDYPKWNAALEGMSIVHSTDYFAGLIQGTPNSPAGQKKAYYIDSDFLRNYCGIEESPREVLRKCGYRVEAFGTNPEESYAFGEGALVFERLRPNLVKKMCDRFCTLMDTPEDLIVTASPYIRHVLTKEMEQSVYVLSVEEAVAACY